MWLASCAATEMVSRGNVQRLGKEMQRGQSQHFHNGEGDLYQSDTELTYSTC